MRVTCLLILFSACGCLPDDDASPIAVAPVSQGVSDPSEPAVVDDAVGAPRPAPAKVELRAPTANHLTSYTSGLGTGVLTAKIKTNYGTIRCELFEDDAPVTVANFVGLARGLHPWLDPTSKRVVEGRRFYDGLSFHRVVSNFVIQGGDPQGDGRGGPGYAFPNEHSRHTFDRAGVLGMANAGPDTNGSQFFITLGPYPHLDSMFTIFGQCDTQAVESIARVEVASGNIGLERSKPTSPVVIQAVRISRRGAD